MATCTLPRRYPADWLLSRRGTGACKILEFIHTDCPLLSSYIKTQYDKKSNIKPSPTQLFVRMVGSVSSNVFENEIRILLGMGTSTHLNVVQLLAYNAETETLVFEYCQHGNLKKFITENRSQFIDELDEVYASCNNPNRVSSYQEVIT